MKTKSTNERAKRVVHALVKKYGLEHAGFILYLRDTAKRHGFRKNKGVFLDGAVFRLTGLNRKEGGE